MSTITNPPILNARDSISATLFDQWRCDGKPIQLKINDGLRYEIKDETSLQKLLDLLERLDNIAVIQKGLEDVAAGRTVSLEEFKHQVREKHGISD